MRSLIQSLSAGIIFSLFSTAVYAERISTHVLDVYDVEDPEEHYHVPVVVSPYGYSTYCGN